MKTLVSKRKRTVSWDTFVQQVKEAQRDPQFRKEIQQFVKITTS